MARRVIHTGKAIVSDFGYVLSSPLRVKSQGFLWIAGVAAATGVMYGYDAEILEGFHRSRGNEVYDVALEVGERYERVGFMGKTAPYWAGGAVIGTALERFEPFRKLQQISFDVLESHAITGIIRNSAKTLIGRERPFEAGRASFFKHGTSLPSGHASVVFEVATILTRHTRGAPQSVRIPVGIVTYGIATGVAIQRVDSKGHWPSDVFLGAASGALIANTVARRNEERRDKDTARGLRSRVSFAPWVDEDGALRGVSVVRSF